MNSNNNFERFLVSEITLYRCIFLQLIASNEKCKILFVNNFAEFCIRLQAIQRRLRDSNP